MNINALFDLQTQLLQSFAAHPFYKRRCFEAFQLDNRITGLMGSRGIGKTSFLLHRVQQALDEGQTALYISADSYYLLDTPMVELVNTLCKQTDIHLLCIDEIQKYEHWSQSLKNIFDTHRDLKVLFTGSSMVDLIRGKYDLSRRVTMHHLHGFSFREYLSFTQQIDLPCYTLEALIENHETITQQLAIPHILMHFNLYLKQGYYPFFSELVIDNDKFQAIENAMQKTIFEDVATLHSLKTPTLLTIERLYKYIVASLPGEISAYKLASILGKDYESVCEYLNILAHAGLIRHLHANQTNKSMLKPPQKLYPENTNLIFSSRLPEHSPEQKGKIRETFAVNQLENAGYPVFYTKQGDFACKDFCFEIGGANKTLKQVKHHEKGYVFADDILSGQARIIPLYLLGLLY